MSYTIPTSQWSITNPLLSLSDTSFNFIKYLHGNWSSISCSNDGTTIAAVNSYIIANMIFISSDSGSTWSNITGDIGSVNLSYIYISDDNLLLSAVRHGYYISNSLTSVSWNFNTNYSFSASVCSNDGTIIAGLVKNNIYFSIDGGSSFTEYITGPIMNCIAMDTSGNIIIAGGGNAIYYSTNSGTSFTETTFSEETSIVSISSDNSSSNIILGTTTNILLSTNYGSTWTTIYTVQANDTLCCVYITQDSSVIYGATIYNGICYSSDGGNTWSLTSPNSKSQNYWSSIATSSNGSIVYASVNGGSIYFVNVS